MAGGVLSGVFFAVTGERQGDGAVYWFVLSLGPFLGTVFDARNLLLITRDRIAVRRNT